MLTCVHIGGHFHKFIHGEWSQELLKDLGIAVVDHGRNDDSAHEGSRFFLKKV